MRALGAIVEDLRRANTRRGRADTGCCAAEGERIVRRAIAAGIQVREVVIGASLLSSGQAEPFLVTLREAGLAPVAAPDALLLGLSEGRRSGLVTALCRLPPNLDPSELTLRAARAAAAAPHERALGGTLLVLVDVREPGNLGSIVRTALACAAAGIWCLGPADPLDPKAVRSSLGGVFRLPLCWTHATGAELFARVRDGLASMHAAGFQTLATCPTEGTCLTELELAKSPIAVVFGNEGEGLAAEVLRECSLKVRIPQSPSVDSFGVAASAAVVLYELNRRQLSGSRSARP